MTRRKKIYEGKAKILYEGPEPGTLIQYFKDDTTAFDAQKKAVLEGKGVINNRMSELFFGLLERAGLRTHFVRRLNDRDMLCKRLQIVPVETVVRKAKEAKLPPVIAAKALAAGDALGKMFAQAVKLGVKIGCGTDSAVSEHGHNGHELVLMVNGGMASK